MNDYNGTFIVFWFRRVVELCFLRRMEKVYCLLLYLGVLAIVRHSFRQRGNHSGPNYPVRYTEQDDHFDARSVEIMRQRFRELYRNNCSSEIPVDQDYMKPNRPTSFRKASQNDFQPVEVNSSYVYSAYLDDRLAPDVDPKALPVVRIFTGLQRNDADEARRNWHCVFWYNMVDLPLVTPVTGITYLNIEDTSYSTISIMVLCSLPTTRRSAPPTAVSLVGDICQGPQNYLPVIDLRKRRQNFEKLSSNASDAFSWNDLNQVSNFTICIPPLYGDYMTTGELIEFIEMNRILGADKFILYLTSPKQELISCLLSYARVGLVELNNFSLPFKPDAIFYRGQILAQNDCLFRTMYRTKYVLQHDFDEFIIPTRATDWHSMLNLIHNNTRPEEVDVAASYNFRNVFFSLEAASDSLLKKPFTVGNYELKTLTKTTCSDALNEWTVGNSKVMGRPERILIWHVHIIHKSNLMRKGDVNVLVGEEDGRLFHYRKLPSGFKHSYNTTNRRIWLYQRQLFESVKSRASSYGCMKL